MRLFIILLLPLLVFADDDRWESDHYEYNHIKKDLSHLELSRDQKKSIKKILKKYKKDIKSFRKYKKGAIKKQRTLFLKSSLDRAELQFLKDDIYKKATELESVMLYKIHSLLTKKQREEFVEYFDEWEIE